MDHARNRPKGTESNHMNAEVRKRYLAREAAALAKATIVREGTIVKTRPTKFPAKQTSCGEIFVDLDGEGFVRYICTRAECKQMGFDYDLHKS